MKTLFEPARSYEVGTYLWGMASTPDSPDAHWIDSTDGVISNRHTVEMAMERIDKQFELDMVNMAIRSQNK